MSAATRKEWKEAIIEYSKELKLPAIRKYLEEYVQEASQRDACYEEFLAQLLQKECDARREASRYNRIRLAQFTHKRYLEDLSISDLPEDAQKKLKLLKTLDFLREGRNVILAGSPGTGKTHITFLFYLHISLHSPYFRSFYPDLKFIQGIRCLLSF